jgi:outer membrane protein assembly factor BamB
VAAVAAVAVALDLPAEPDETSLGHPITSVTIPASAQGPGERPGQNLAYVVANGVPAEFSAIDIADGSVVFHAAMEHTHASWGMVTTPDGAVYFGTQRHGQLFRWRPGAKELENLSGRNLIGESHIWRLAADEQGRIFGGTYPNGKVFAYDPRTGKVRDYGTLKEGVQYVRSTTVAGDYIYAGTSPQAHVFRIHKESGRKDEIPLPDGYANADAIYDITTSGGFLFARATPSSDLLVYDLSTSEWINRFPGTLGLEVTPPGPDGRIYFGQGQHLMAYDPRTNEAERTGASIPFGTRSSRWVDLGRDGYPGLSLVTVGMRGDLFFYNPETGRAERRVTEVPGVPISIRALEQGPDGNVYVGGYLAPQEMAMFDPDVGELRKLPGTAQVEAMHIHEGKLYIGRYPNAGVLEYDLEKPWHFGRNPRVVAQLSSHNQDRPFGFASVGKQLAIGTVPRSGRLGGVLAFFDTADDSVEVREEVVPRQSIISLAHREGLLYGGTSVWGGLGIAPAAEEAVLFIWDVERGEKVWESSPVAGEKAIGDLVFDEEGMLWGITQGTLFRFDPKSREVVLRRELFRSDWERTVWQSSFLEYDEEQKLFYIVSGGRLLSYVPQADRVTELARGVSYLARDRHGNLYTARGTGLWQIRPPQKPVAGE